MKKTPFVSRLNSRAPGFMVVVAPEPAFRVMDRSGCGGYLLAASREPVPGTFQVAIRIAP
jgi:hypothetical protein